MSTLVAQKSKGRFARLFTTGAIIIALGATASAQELYGTLKKIDESNTLTIGHRESSVPFSYYDESKQPIGYAIDLCNKIADEVKKVLKKPDLRIVYRPVNAQTRMAAVVDHTVDMECGTTTNTLGRQQQVDFSAIYFTTGTRLLARKSAQVREIEDLQGKRVAVVDGSTNQRAIAAMASSGKLDNLQIVVVKDYSDGLAALEKNAIEAFATDDIVLYGLASKSAAKDELEVVGRFLTYDPYGIMLRRDDSAFRLIINRTLATLFRSGEIEKIYAKWFGPLGVPVSPLMKAGFALQALPE